MKRPTGSRILCVLGILMASGCGSDSKSAEDECRLITATICERLFECLTPDEIALRNVGTTPTDCHLILIDEYQCTGQTTSNACDPGQRYDRAAADECAAAYETLTCGALRDEMAISACERICTGESTLPDGGAACTDDAREPNGTTGTATDTGLTAAGMFNQTMLSLCTGDTDMFRFETGATADLTVGASSPDGGIMLTLLSSAGVTIVTGTNSLNTFALPGSTTYYVIAQPAGAPISSYSLGITVSDN